MNYIRIFKSKIALLMAIVTILGVMPANAFADETKSSDFIYYDGESISVSDERVIKVAPTRSSKTRSLQPNVSEIASLSAEFARNPSVTMNGTRVSAIRYVAKIDGIGYEAYCADPLLKGPESGAAYAITSEASSGLRNALTNGYPINSAWSSVENDDEDRMWWAYITRVAVAIANNPSKTFAGDADAISQAKNLANGTTVADADTYPAIVINGEKDTKDTGRTVVDEMAQSKAFEIGYNRKTNNTYSPFTFEWSAGTPAGAKLIVDGNVIATAPQNSDRVFGDDISSFYIEMPKEAAFVGKEATVNLVGIHNQFANKIWLMQNPSNPSGYQDIVFYIPEVNASATFSFLADTEKPDPDPDPDPEKKPEPASTSVKIQKIDALSRKNISGALVRLRGISANTVVTGGTVPSTGDTHRTLNNTGINMSQVLTSGATIASGDGVTSKVTDGVWELEGLPYGAYIVEEERAPENYSLLPQHTSYGFWLLPPDVTVDVAEVDVIQNPETGEVLETVVDYEIKEDGKTSAVLITFENYPFGEIEVTKYDEVTGDTLSGAHFRIQGYFAEGNTNGMPIDRVQSTESNGKTVFKDLPAGQYTITEIEAPPGYQLDTNTTRSVSITWGQSASTTFYNKPKTTLVVTKVDANDGKKFLAGATFELKDPTNGRIWTGTTGTDGKATIGNGPDGNELYGGKTYILTEIKAPNGYILDSAPREVVLKNIGENEILLKNWKNPSLTIIKRDKDNGQERLEGAVFDVSYENGKTVTGSPFTTDANGEILINEILFDDTDERTLIVTETIPPAGYNLSDPTWQRVTVRKGEDNTIVFENTRKPTLEIHKTDAVNGKGIEGAEFTIEKLEAPDKGMLTGNPFHTDSNGKIVLEYQYSGKYRIVETKAANNYWFDPQQQNREWIIEVKDNENYTLAVENTLLPTLIVTKWNSVTYKPVPLTHFKVEYEVPNTGKVELVGNYTTNSSGQIVLPYCKVGWYRVTETKAAPGMSLNTNNNYRVYLNPGDNSYLSPVISTDDATITFDKNGVVGSNVGDKQSDAVVSEAVTAPTTRNIIIGSGDMYSAGEGIWNYPLNSIVIKKTDATNGRLLEGASFDLIYNSSGESGTKGTVIGRYTTNFSGIIVITGLEPGAYTVEEVDPPKDYMLSVNNRQTAYLKPDGHSIVEVEFSNYPYGSLLITKHDEVTGSALQGAEFRVQSSDGTLIGTNNGRFVTNQQGEILISNLAPDSYVVTETRPPSGYVIGDNPSQTINVKPDGQVYHMEFINKPLSNLTVRKLDSYDNSPIVGAKFRVERQNGEFVGEYETDQQGLFSVNDILGWFKVTEIDPASGYVMDNSMKTIEVKAGSPAVLVFYNSRQGGLTVEKQDQDGKPLAGAKFRVTKQNGEFVGEYTSNASGIINVGQLESGWYIIEETAPPDGYIITEGTKSVEIKANAQASVTFINKRTPTLTIEKVDVDGKPLANAEFEIRKADGSLAARVKSNSGGMAVVAELSPGSYEVIETNPPAGYVADQNSQFIEIDAGESKSLRFVNKKIAEVAIKKVDGETGAVLQGVEFEIRHLNGELVRNPEDNTDRFVTNNAGLIHLPHLSAGSYVATETKALDGYNIAEPKSFLVTDGKNITVTIENYKKHDTVIKKIDGDTEAVLPNVQFEIAKYVAPSAGGTQNTSVGDKLRNPLDGSYIFTTDSAGLIKLPALDNGTYVATELKPQSGYLNAEPRIFTVGNDISYNDMQTIIIKNYKQSKVAIKKIDGDTDAPLEGVIFEIRAMNGERIRNLLTGTFEFTTDNAGLISLPSLDAGAYTAVETKALSGYRNSEPVNFEIKDGENQTVLIRNYKHSELTIKKINSETRNPLQGVVFQISKPNGEKLKNPKTGFYDFTTDSNGLIHLPVIEDGNYWLTEIKALDGFIANPEPLLLTIDSSARQREHLLVVENTPASGLLIIKTDAQTDKPLAGVTFEVRHADGRIVQGDILDGNQKSTDNNSPQLNAGNGFTTNNRGRINLNHLTPGVYHVVETEPLAGYELDTKVHVVTVETGKQAVLKVKNTPLSGLRILKTDAVTGAPIFGVEFMLFDHNGKVVGNFYSDNRGIVEFPASLVAGRYTIRETRPAEGYATDDMPRTIDFVPGRVTEIEWKNTPMGGQLQISKVSGDHNEQNALPSGTPLSGAIFEIFSYRTGNLVDRIISDNRGTAVSKPLPIGRYYAVEVSAPAFYKINPQKIDFDVEYDRQIIKVTFPNYSANIGVTIDKTGPREVMQGNNIFYDIKTVRNDSTVPLTDFYWRDILPTNAVRADKLVTGTYNQSLRYKVLGKTNKGNEIVIADNLSTMQNNVVELKPVNLGLASDEYITEFTLYFGTVPAGFTAVDKPKVYVDVLSASHTFLPNGMMLANKADIGGKVAGSNEWVISNSTAASTVFNPVKKKIPQSGY